MFETAHIRHGITSGSFASGAHLVVGSRLLERVVAHWEHSWRARFSMNNESHFDGHLTSLVGTSAAMQKLMDLIRKVGSSDVSVLVQGESGTGKELVARAIYRLNPRGEFVPIDCGALSVNLAESELFGHEKGAFTGAADSRKGLLETAHGGTAFFDEIGELPPEVQAKLLRVLQQHEVRPLGANRVRPCKFRVIAATNRNLAEEVENRRFRLDLYYRLNVVTLEIPPLRKRQADIPILVEHFLRQTGRTYRLGPKLMENLVAHAWPGNVRELQNCIARLVAFASNGCLDAADLPFPPRPSSPSRPQRWPQVPSEPVGLTMLAAEQRAICRALTSSSGNTTEAARSLGISRTTLYRRRKLLKLEQSHNTAETGRWLPDAGREFDGLMTQSDMDEDDPMTATIRSTFAPAESACWGGMHERGEFYGLMPKPLTAIIRSTFTSAAWLTRPLTESIALLVTRARICHVLSLTA